jgi:hypothetical protein
VEKATPAAGVTPHVPSAGGLLKNTEMVDEPSDALKAEPLKSALNLTTFPENRLIGGSTRYLPIVYVERLSGGVLCHTNEALLPIELFVLLLVVVLLMLFGASVAR